MNLRQQAKEATRARIVVAAKARFEKFGYANTTVRDIAADIDMSTGAVFGSFPGKDAIYVACFGHLPLTPEEGRALKAELEALKGAA